MCAQMGDNNSIIGKPGPFQIIEALGSGEVDSPIEPPRRRYDCHNYEVCLDIATALNWDSYTCRGCSTEINQALLWRAHQAARKDTVAGSLCERLPHIGVHESKPEAAAETPDLEKPTPRKRATAIDKA